MILLLFPLREKSKTHAPTPAPKLADFSFRTMNHASLLDRQDIIQRARRVGKLLVSIDSSAEPQIEQAVDQFNADKFRITILGKAKRGKSTLINAWLGRHDDLVAPIDKLPATSVITEVMWAEHEGITIRFRNGQQQAVALTRIRDYATEELNPENIKGVSMLEVRSPFPDLEHDLILVDTPGAGSIHEHHDQILHAFIPQSDAVIFLFTAAMPLDEDELDLLRKVKAADIQKVFFVINKVDAAERPEDIEDAIDHNQRCLQDLNIEVHAIHRLSAKRAYEGDFPGSGLDALKQEIAEFLKVNKAQVLQVRFLSRVRAVAQPVIERLAIRLASARKSDAALDADLQNLGRAKQAILTERPVSEKEFRNRWNLAVDNFARGLKQAAHEVAGRMDAAIEKAPLSSLDTLQKELPTLLENHVRECLEPHTQKLEHTLLDATNAMKASYPAIEILSETAAIRIKVNEGNAFLVGGFAGAATTATGVALAWAASTAVTAVLTPTLLGTIGAMTAGLAGYGGLGAIISALGTAAVPTWLALAGPVGWTIAGIGALVVPLAWRTSKMKLKAQLSQACNDQVVAIFNALGSERIPEIRRMADTILEEYRDRLDRQLGDIESEVAQAKNQRPSPEEIVLLENQVGLLTDALRDPPAQSAN
jgi:GTPase Era involved in 16S rRNA processing